MQIKMNESQEVKKTSGTYNAISVTTSTLAAAANAAIASTDFNKSSVKLEVKLKRRGQTVTLVTENLAILNILSHLKDGFHEANNGVVKVAAAAGVKETKVFSSVINFGGHIRVNAGDELSVRCTVSNGAFSAAIDSTASYVDFDFVESIGYEFGTPYIVSEPITQGTSSQTFNLGENILEVMLVNLDKTTYANEVVSSLTVASDRWNKSFTYDQLIAHHWQNGFKSNNERWATAAGTESFKIAPYSPQTFQIFAGNGQELDKVSMSIALNAANVAASQNYVVYRKYTTSPEQIREAQARALKHKEEKMRSL